jgi:hypothetical protein
MVVLEGKEEKRKNKPKALTVKGLRVKIRLWKTFLFEPIVTTKNRQNEP